MQEHFSISVDSVLSVDVELFNDDTFEDVIDCITFHIDHHRRQNTAFIFTNCFGCLESVSAIGADERVNEMTAEFGYINGQYKKTSTILTPSHTVNSGYISESTYQNYLDLAQSPEVCLLGSDGSMGEQVTIIEILESESDKDRFEDKGNRVDVKAKTSEGEIIIVEVQLAREAHFMHRILYGTSKAVIEQLEIGQDYEHIKKVYSINVLYFDLGNGEDYVYHGTTTFRGMTKPDSILEFKQREEEFVKESAPYVASPENVFPEYFLLRVNQFNTVAKTPIEDWMAYLKDGSIKPDTQTPGLQEAREKLDYMRMTREERRAYEEYMVSVHAAKDVYETAVAEGMAEGIKQGMAKGILQIARNMKEEGIPLSTIAKLTGLGVEEIEKL